MSASSWRKIRNVVAKEWANALRTPNSVLFMSLLPFLIVAQVMVVIWLVVRLAGGEGLSATILLDGVHKLEKMIPEITNLPLQDQFKLFFYSQMPVYILLIPAMIANGLATFSIVEEKQTHTLEPLLATPVKTLELLLAKALYGALPAVMVTWVCAGLVLAGIAVIGPSYLVGLTLTPAWILSLLLIVPLITFLSFLIGVIGSARACDAKSAQNLAVVVVLPILGLVALQVTGLVGFDVPWLLVVSGVLVGLDVLVLWIAVKLFRRESIVIRWK